MKKFLCLAGLFLIGCGGQSTVQVSRSGVDIAKTTVVTESNGKTVEQNNIIERLNRDNQPGSVKHLYVISAYSGDVLIYSTVKGKVTSSGKRLSPKTGSQPYELGKFIPMRVEGNLYTNEVLGDDGTFGDSIEYLYWFDSKGIYHQHYVMGGQILHISDSPLVVKKPIINLEEVGK